ncbi:alpha/beta fold hydrolase [Microbulbifer sp. CAU 1566]|uniref:alpha/beta hydrolase n=1 Tax=Microbulbifer sp. CAU 1566 TaxID=2933269 RepID=UPI0020046FD7|nr:alpha/beta fold hydrolase [Microbulbifer sp. CAU 1566]MCK7596769.1 alpha/beta fold hydrolase [Microbulbifer sp. CAU 1566]
MLPATVRLLLASVATSLLLLVTGYIVYLNRGPELPIWLTTELDEEFTEETQVASFTEYLALEDRLFAQLDREIYAKTAPATESSFNRYQRGSLADPARWSPNWNRSFLLERNNPHAMVLLLHGLTDAPYSLRHLGQRFHESGATVLGLRIPGHGTAPSGLTTVSWQDMAAAVKLAMRHLAETGEGRPIYIVGYSNGAALGIHYALSTLDNPELPRVEKLVLLSPEIGISPVAALAVWQARVGHFLGMDKVAWDSVHSLEYEPFKYGSFAINAAALSHEITREIKKRVRALSKERALGDMPPILSFASVVDATVEATAVVEHLYNLLPEGGHQLVLFDINRQVQIEPLLTWKPDRMLAAIQQAPHRNYTLTMVTNAGRGSADVVARHWPEGEQGGHLQESLGLRWPKNIYSLSHVALPFPPDDSIYGGRPEGKGPGIQLGGLALRGERGALRISAAAQLRLRWNPFYSWQEDHTVHFLNMTPSSGASPSENLHVSERIRKHDQ